MWDKGEVDTVAEGKKENNSPAKKRGSEDFLTLYYLAQG